MQRVLSFPPPSRGFGDPSEFVSKRMCFSFMFSLGFLAFLGGFLLGRFVFDQELELSRNKLKKAHLHHQQVFGVYKNYSQYNVSSLLEGISQSTIEEYLGLFSNNDTSTDSASRAFKHADILRNHLVSNGFDLVSPLVEFQMHLSYPSATSPNQAFILDENNRKFFQCNDTRPVIKEESEKGFIGSATAEGNILYVNFGRYEDYHYLTSLGITVGGNIVLIRAGRIAPSDMVINALEQEAEGIIIFVDPEQKDVKIPILNPGELAKIQILHGNQIDKWKRSIPLLEISSSDAEKILNTMSTKELSAESWRGKLKSSYPIGPGFRNAAWKMKMEVNSVNIVETYFDVMGAIRGSQEPDRFVMLVNEKNNNELKSKAVMMEIVRVMGNLKKSGWTPHRSIVVAFLEAESENHRIVLDFDVLRSQFLNKAVTYLKVNSPYGIGEMNAVVSPALEKLFFKAIRTVRMTNLSIDIMQPLGPNNFFVQYGIPYLMMDSFSILSNYSLKEMASFWGVITWNIAESHGLPFSLESYINFFTHSIEVVDKRFKLIAKEHNLFLDSLFKTVQDLIAILQFFENKWSHADKSKSIEMRIMNDQLLDFVHSMNCDKDPTVSTNILSSGHIIFSKSFTGSDNLAGFGILQDLLREITSIRASEDLKREIIMHLSALVDCLRVAKYTLTDSLETFITWKA